MNKSFIDNYLLDSGSVDNYLFENCEKVVLDEIYKVLRTSVTKKRQCIVKLTNEEEKQVLALLDKCKSSYERTVLTRDFVNAKIMVEVYRGVDKALFERYTKQLNAFYNLDIVQAKENHRYGVLFPYDIINYVKNKEKIELNVFFENIKSFEIQRAFNNYMSARLPLSVKFFMPGRMVSNADESVNMIQSPHDFISVNVSKFIETEEKDNKEF